MVGHSEFIVLIDLGQLVNMILATSHHGLDCPLVGSLEYDLICLAVTIYEIDCCILETAVSRNELRDVVAPKGALYASMVVECLGEKPNLEKLWKLFVNIAHTEIGEFPILSELESVWRTIES